MYTYNTIDDMLLATVKHLL